MTTFTPHKCKEAEYCYDLSRHRHSDLHRVGPVVDLLSVILYSRNEPLVGWKLAASREAKTFRFLGYKIHTSFVIT